MKTISEGRAAPLTPDERAELLTAAPSHSSVGLGWSGVRVEHVPGQPTSDIDLPPLAEYFFILQGRPPLAGRFGCGGVDLDGPPDEGAVAVIPSGASSYYRWDGVSDSTHFQLSRAVVARVAVEACDLDPANVRFRPVLFGNMPPAIAATLAALRDELLSGGPGGRVCAESLTTVLAVHLIRHLASGPAVRGLTGVLARPVVRAVEEYVEDNLDQSIGLADLAAVAHLSEYHFARLFNATTGQTPHQFVIAKRVARAKELIRERRLTLAEVAAAVGFADQSHLHRHFKRLVGVTPKQFLGWAGGEP